MKVEFVVRLLTEDDQVLAWARVPAESRPQDTRAACPFFASGLTHFVAELDGSIAKLVVHWPELNVARMLDQPERHLVKAGQEFNFVWLEPVWLVGGMENVPMPAVTERAPVRVAPPVGDMAAVGHI